MTTFNIVVFVTRKPGTTPDEFKHHYETSHVPLVKAISGDTFPTSHKRHYIDRQALDASSSDTSNANYPATVFLGASKTIDYDAYTELTFRHAAHFQAFIKCFEPIDIAERVAEDEMRFTDRSTMKIVVIGHVETTIGTS